MTNSSQTPALGTQFQQRTLSAGEYYHACVGSYKGSYDQPRENTLILEGSGRIDVAEFRRAVAAAATCNPGAHLKLHGDSLFARWSTAGEVPEVREIRESEWDGKSSKGSSFIYEKPLLIRKGVSGEFILLRNNTLNKTFIIFRNLHAVMDGIGTLHFLREIFRSLRAEPLIGSNASFREVDLIRSVGGEANEFADHKQKPAYATGGVQGAELGDAWQRISLDGPIPWMLARVAGIIAEHATALSDRVARIAVPVNLRRHMPEIQSTMNYSNVLHVDLKKGEGMTQFQKRLHKALTKKADAHYLPFLNWARMLPMAMMDRIACRNNKTYLSDRIFETAMISDLGVFPSEEFSYRDFHTEQLYGIPIAGNTFCLISTVGTRVNITLGMPKIYASNGRLNRLTNLIRDKLMPEN